MLEIILITIGVYLFIGLMIFLYTHYLLKDLDYFRMVDMESKLGFAIYIIILWLPLIIKNL